MGTQIHFQINSIVRSSTKVFTNNHMLHNEKAKNAKRESEKLKNKLRIREPLDLKSHKIAKGKGPLEVCHMSN